MDFNAMRLSLLAGIGDPNDRHDIVKEQVKQLNESSEARQLNEDEEEVRKAVRRTIQKMISEGTISLQEDSISRELEHLRANIKADHDHIEALVHDMHDDRDEIERAEHHREEMHEDEKTDEGRGEDMLRKHNIKPMEESEQVEETLSEADATLTRLQMLAGVRILSEARDEDVEEAHCNEDEDPMEEAVVDGVKPDDLDGPPPNDSVREEEAHDEAKLYELEDGRMYMEMDGRRYMMQEMEEELNELEEEDAHYVGKDPEGKDVVSVDGKLGTVE